MAHLGIPLDVFESFKATDCFYISPSYVRPTIRINTSSKAVADTSLSLSFFTRRGRGDVMRKSEKIQTFDGIRKRIKVFLGNPSLTVEILPAFRYFMLFISS